jgi:hypothetical protein
MAILAILAVTVSAAATLTVAWLRLIHRFWGPAIHARLVRPLLAAAAGLHLGVLLVVLRLADYVDSQLLIGAWLVLQMAQAGLFGLAAILGLPSRQRSNLPAGNALTRTEPMSSPLSGPRIMNTGQPVTDCPDDLRSGRSTAP